MSLFDLPIFILALIWKLNAFVTWFVCIQTWPLICSTSNLLFQMVLGFWNFIYALNLFSGITFCLFLSLYFNLLLFYLLFISTLLLCDPPLFFPLFFNIINFKVWWLISLFSKGVLKSSKSNQLPKISSSITSKYWYFFF